MREINNNINGIKPEIKIEKKNLEKTSELNAEVENKNITDFSNPKAEALGRSQVNVANKDNLKTDIAFLSKNPDAVKSADRFFDVAYAQLLQKDVPNAYEKAAAMATIYAREVATK